MRIFTTACLAALAALGARAAVVTPLFYSEDFIAQEEQGDYPTDGWETWGNGAIPAPSMQEYFGTTGDGPAYLLFSYDSKAYAFSCTNFDPPQPADQWLVSPLVEMPVDNAELWFTAAVFCNRGNWGLGRNPIKVMMQAEGQEEWTEVYTGQVSGSDNVVVNTKNIYCPLNVAAGQKIRLGFVSTGQDLGMTGFTDICMGEYALTFDNKTVSVADPGEEVVIDMNIGMKAPVACPGFTAVLEAGEHTQTLSFTKQFGGSGTSLLYQRVKFDPIQMDYSSTLNYKVTVTPNYEGAVESSITGSVGLALDTYVNNVVMEELTATGCQWCPSGAASAEYYHDTYPGTDGVGKVISIAVHDNLEYADPMNEGVEDYVAGVKARNEYDGLPSATFNRATRGTLPYRPNTVVNELDKRSYNHVRLTGVDAPDAESPADKTVTAMFEVRNAYSAENRPIGAALVLVENNVRGNSSGYMQANTYYNKNSDFIIDNYGEWMYPYIKEYLQGGELGYAKIPPSKMTYQHVARGIFPSFYGELLTEVWEADVPQQFELSFAVPETVLDFANTEVVVLVIDGLGNIVASDSMPYASYTSGVDAVVPDSTIAVNILVGNVYVTGAPADAQVEVYATDGTLLARRTGSGHMAVSRRGVALVRVTAPGLTTVRKVML